MAKIDDFLGKKKEVGPILDLSKTVPKSKEEFRKLLDKVPDFKIKPEKVKPEDIKIREKHFKFKTGKADYKAMKEPFLFQNPVPVEMRDLKLKDLISVSIDWKMLTTLRPKTKVDEEFFSRLIELGKAELKTRASDKRAIAMDPQIRKTKNKAGVVEMRVVSCKECGEDFCTGKACSKFSYDSFARISIDPSVPVAPVKKAQNEPFKSKSGKKLRKSRSKSRKRESKSRSQSTRKGKEKKSQTR